MNSDTKTKAQPQDSEETEAETDKARFEKDYILETGSVLRTKGRHAIHCLTVIGQIEGHSIAPQTQKTTKYEHVIPQLVSIEEDPEVEGLLVILNTVGGDVEAGLALAELISGITKPSATLVLGGGHSIGIPLAVSARRSFIVPTATMTVHPVRHSGLVLGVPQTMRYFEQMRAMGRDPETTILDFCEMEADKNLAEHMGLRIGDRIFKLKRLRSADNMPMMVERSYLPVRQFLSLKRPLLERKPLYDVIEQDFQQKIRVAEEEFYASIARPTDAHLLGIVEGSPVLDLVRTTYNESNEVVEYTLSVARADQFKYKVYHQRSN